jgi:hypothetical protein
MNISNQDQPEPNANSSPENSEVLSKKDISSEIIAGSEPIAIETNIEAQKVGRFHFIRSFLANLFNRQKIPLEEKDNLQASNTITNLPVEMEGHEDLVEKRLEKLFDEQQEMDNEPLPSDELEEKEAQTNLNLTNPSQNTLTDQLQPENPPLIIEAESTPNEESLLSARLSASLLPQDLDELEKPEGEVHSDGESGVNGRILQNPDNENRDFSEDPDLIERFQSFLSPEETPEEKTAPFQPAFISDDLENLTTLGEDEKEKTNDFSPYETTDASQLELPDYWNKAFTTDPIPLMNVPSTSDIEVDEKKDEPEEYPSRFQERLAQFKNTEDEKDKNSLIIQNGLAQIENQRFEEGEDLDIISEGLAQSANAIEEIPPNPWEIELERSSVRNPEESLGLAEPSVENLKEPSQVEPAATAPEKGYIASTPKFLKILIISLLVIDLAIIGFVGNSYLRIISPQKPTPTVVPTDISYIYPNVLKLTGGWIIPLNKGNLVNDKWTPVSAEWLIDTSFRRVIALPWSEQLEAVVLTLKQGDPIDLYMINNDVVLYQVEKVMKVPQEDTSFLKSNTPALIIILYRTDSQDRWVIICGQS